VPGGCRYEALSATVEMDRRLWPFLPGTGTHELPGGAGMGRHARNGRPFPVRPLRLAAGRRLRAGRLLGLEDATGTTGAEARLPGTV